MEIIEQEFINYVKFMHDEMKNLEISTKLPKFDEAYLDGDEHVGDSLCGDHPVLAHHDCVLQLLAS